MVINSKVFYTLANTFSEASSLDCIPAVCVPCRLWTFIIVLFVLVDLLKRNVFCFGISLGFDFHRKPVFLCIYVNYITIIQFPFHVVQYWQFWQRFCSVVELLLFMSVELSYSPICSVFVIRRRTYTTIPLMSCIVLCFVSAPVEIWTPAVAVHMSVG